MQLKLRQILMFVLACVVLIISELPGGALLALAALMQLSLLIQGIPFNKKSQIAAVKLFLVSIPVFFFWGGAHSFINIHMLERSYLLSAMSIVLSALISFLIAFQVIYVYSYLEKNDYSPSASLQSAFNDIKEQSKLLFKTTALIFVFSLIPWLAEDWKLVFSIFATLSYLNLNRLKEIK